MTPHVKWVNDIFCHGRKVARYFDGKLDSPETQSIEALIVGVGINLTPPKAGYPQAIADIAGYIDWIVCLIQARNRSIRMNFAL